MNKDFEEKRGYYAALKSIMSDGNTVAVAQHSRDVAECDPTEGPFTRGWIRACEEFIDNNTIPDTDQ